MDPFGKVIECDLARGLTCVKRAKSKHIWSVPPVSIIQVCPTVFMQLRQAHVTVALCKEQAILPAKLITELP